jgi:MFS family permease
MNFYLLMVVVAAFSVDTWRVDAGVAGVATSIFVVGALASRAFVGKVMGHCGYKNTMLLGMAVNAIASVSYLFVPSIGLLIAARLVHGLGFGMVTSAAPAIVAGVVPNERLGEGMGYFSLAGPIAAGIGPFVAMLLVQDGGYLLLFVLCALIMLIVLALIALLRIPRIELSPQDREDLRGFKLKSIIEVPVVPVSLVALLMYSCYGGIVSFLALFLRELGLADYASLFFVVYAVVVLLSRPFAGRLFDARGASPLIIPALLILAAGFTLFSQTQDLWMLAAAAVMVGLGVGAVQTATLAVVAKITPPSRRGIGTTTYYLMSDVGYSLGPLLAGLSIPLLGYRGMFLALGLLTLGNFAYYFLYQRGRMGSG